MDKRLAKRHKRQVARAKDKAEPTAPDVRTQEQIEAAREASRNNSGSLSQGPKLSTGGQSNRKNFAASTGSAAKTGI